MKYAGIGSRETPQDVLEWMENVAAVFAHEGFTLSTGGADGADTAFQKGCEKVDGNLELYLPWFSYNNHVKATLYNPTNEAIEMASKHHPAWWACKSGAKKLHGRNSHIILGWDLKQPVDFVICWTKDGKPSGGTALGINLATANNIPVFNVGDYSQYGKLEKFLAGVRSK